MFACSLVHKKENLKMKLIWITLQYDDLQMVWEWLKKIEMPSQTVSSRSSNTTKEKYILADEKSKNIISRAIYEEHCS